MAFNPIRNRMRGRPDADAQMSCRRRCAYDAWLTRREDVSVMRACGLNTKWICSDHYRKMLQLILDPDHYRKILQLILSSDHVHCLKRWTMSTWNLRRCNPACKVVHMASVQIQPEYIPIDTRERPITRTSYSEDVSRTRHTQ